MGIYVDYFRAADDKVARRTHLLPGGPLHAEPGRLIPFDGVATKGILPDPHLVQLVALAGETSVEDAAEVTRGLWPPPATPPPADETSPWVTDPGVERLASRIRDVLADIHLDRLDDLAQRWSARFPDIPVALATTVVLDLSALARRARESGQELYGWSTL